MKLTASSAVSLWMSLVVGAGCAKSGSQGHASETAGGNLPRTHFQDRPELMQQQNTPYEKLGVNDSRCVNGCIKGFLAHGNDLAVGEDMTFVPADA